MSYAGLSFDAIDQIIDWHETTPSTVANIPVDFIDKARAAICEAITRGPVLRQYVSHLDRGLSGGVPKNVHPWHAEGERQYAASLFASVGVPNGCRLVSSVGEDLGTQMALGFGMMTLAAAVYLWSDDIEQLATAAPLPSHVISRDALPMPVMFWSRETAHMAPDGRESNWMLVMHSNVGIRMAIDLVSSSTAGEIIVADIPYGARYPDDFEYDEHQLAGVSSVLTRLAFLASPYIAADAEKLPRAWRREMSAAGLPAQTSDPLIHVVKLRHEARANVDQERHDNAMPPGRKSHWWVSGHYRKQWYAATEAHKVIWIAPYLKGDPSKPLAKKVYAVVR